MLLGAVCVCAQTWVALCAVGLEQFLDHHIHELPEVEDWDISVIIPVSAMLGSAAQTRQGAQAPRGLGRALFQQQRHPFLREACAHDRAGVVVGTLMVPGTHRLGRR